MAQIIKKYGILLRPLERVDLELVRRWRNDPSISRHMEFREYISCDDQIRWFDSINNAFNLYWIVQFDEVPVGLFNFKNINLTDRSAEAGIFIWECALLNSTFAFATAISALDYAFDTLGLSVIHARILDQNKRAIRFNKALGFVPTLNTSPNANRLYTLESERYATSAETIRRVLEKSFAR